MTTKDTTHLAGQFLVAGELSRRGYPVSITKGNGKSVDIYAEGHDFVPIRVDARAGRTKTSWPVSEKSIQDDVYYIFVYLGPEDQIGKNESPEYFIAKGTELKTQGVITTWQSRQGVHYSALCNDQYKDNWKKLPPP
jgi:hypothetical protein